jgi:hypothetical protein
MRSVTAQGRPLRAGVELGRGHRAQHHLADRARVQRRARPPAGSSEDRLRALEHQQVQDGVAVADAEDAVSSTSLAQLRQRELEPQRQGRAR